MSDRIPMTLQGYEKLEEELEHLKKKDRPQIVKEIEIARAHGDISENAEFHAAKEKQSHIEGKHRDRRRHRRNNAEISPKTEGLAAILKVD